MYRIWSISNSQSYWIHQPWIFLLCRSLYIFTTAFATMRTLAVVTFVFTFTSSTAAFAPKSSEELQASVSACTNTPDLYTSWCRGPCQLDVPMSDPFEVKGTITVRDSSTVLLARRRRKSNQTRLDVRLNANDFGGSPYLQKFFSEKGEFIFDGQWEVLMGQSEVINWWVCLAIW